jgi:Mrp family chromosome partitioning ATPase/capsular polysaccharide biosynthesis protein
MKLTGPRDKTRGLLRTHLWLVLLATCVAVGAAVAAAAAKPVTYTATAEVVVSPQKTESTPLLPDMGTERAVAQSGVVVQHGAAALQADEATVRRGLSVSNVLDSRVLRISYTANTPEAAYHGARVLATSYVDYRNDRGDEHAATLVTPPALPASGSRGSLPLYLLLGLVAGLTVGVAAAWLWDRLSDRVRSSTEFHELTGLPILTRMHRWRSARSPLPPDGPARECFAFVAARLASMTGHSGGKTIMITSPRTGAGTTSVACGAAVALAGQGKRVVLIAASHGTLRPELMLGVTPSPGLSHLLSMGCSLELALHPTEVRNLSMVRMGGGPGASLDLEDVHLVLERLERRAFVVIDAPPVLTSADSLLLADVSDLVVLVGDLRSGTRTDVHEALALLDDVRPRLAGWVANRPPRRRGRARKSDEVTVSAPPGPSVASTGDPAADTQPLMPPADSDRPNPGPGRPATAARAARWRQGTRPPGVPRTATPARDGVRPLRAPAAAARRR